MIETGAKNVAIYFILSLLCVLYTRLLILQKNIPGHGIFFMGVGRPNFGRGGQFFCEGGSNFFSPKRGVKGWVKFFWRKMSKIYRF